MDNKKLPLFLLLIFSMQMMSACSGEENRDTKDAAVSDNGNNEQGQILFEKDDKDDKVSLSISSRCIGCNHCIRFDPAHFSYSPGAKIPVVTSQSDLDSSDLKSAIARCPARAITLDS